ncbi:hypothetical protein QQS21_009457 [Conoideocrella luteorostrata]|uniref:RZ-type domain-containing protein n=1 Tax=Conoideocrella luteorostrata TaxID=1105319 RepID=A0AAJ0CH41_9HYPO|nr:hypothetical protein QQS21_009457 [Conoideocrella luteorostrata]
MELDQEDTVNGAEAEEGQDRPYLKKYADSSIELMGSGPWTNTAVEETFENKQAKADYNVWKRQIKFPPQTDNLGTVQRLWDGALEILNGDERDWKQMVPRDLDHEEYHGRQHIKIVMDMRVQSGDYEILIRRVSPFLLTITHPIFLDCLSVDTFVGGLYNFISGTNGTRAVPSFQHLCTALVQTHVNDMATVTTDTIERTLAALSTALRELIQREPRCRFNDDLPSLLESIGNALRVIIGDESSRVSTVILNQIGEMQVILSRAKGLLVQENDQVQELSTIVVPATYPHTLIMPRDLHDNDKSDVTHIKIFPTREEILSDVAGYLPTTDLDQPHFLSNQVERHIDTHFRLLRHDTFGELKYSLGGLMHAAENDPAQLDNPRLSFGDFQAYHYTKASVSFVSFDSRRGLEVIISFPQPSAVRNKSAYERLGWWEDSRRLPPGVLLSFVSLQDGKSQHLFLTVTERSIDASEDKSLVKDDKQANIIAKLTNQDQTNIESVVRLSSNKVRGVLVEFPGVLPATFVPILENLQNMQRLGRLPFRQWILPERIDNPQEIPEVTIRPPLYARQLGFAFPLKSVLRPDRKDTRDLYLSPNSSGDYVGIIEELDAETELDRGQCRALVAALTREYALIQGPPGTGKSYLGIQLMKVLISCKEIVELGPIVVVCYTNHALDQFLEHLISINVRKIIRIGGQSQSSLLQGHNLRVVSQLDQKSRSENYHLATSFEGLDKHTKQITRILDIARSMTKRPKWKSFQYHLLENHLLENYERIYHQFSQVDEEGYRTVGRPFELWAPEEIFLVDLGDERETNRTGEVERIVEKAETNIHTLSRRERHCLVQFWCRQIYDQALNDLFEEVKAADVTQGIITNVHDEVDRRVLQDADVIGITTTGLAKRISTLKHVKCKVIICEEAGEVMEPHMISALLPTVEHFIQIGDHEQLRPQINNHSLSLESKQGALYQLDRSQFERLSVGVPGRPKMPLAQLNIQRRMRPEISTLIRSTIYPELRDHQSIVTLPDVVGMRKNVFWLDHNHFEEGQLSEMHHKSHSNIWEAEMVHALVRHIIRQGAYKSSEIAILTPYTGQLQLLRFALRNDFEIVLSDRDQDALEKNGFNNLDTVVPGEDSVDDSSGHRKMSLAKKKLSDLLRVATVDNFQGEEAKVVIVSLVRSNEKRKVGFLRTKNRINVLLSRAQHGMYLIGNTTTYSEIPMWHSIVGLLRATASVNTICGETCPEEYCTACGRKQDSRVDLLEMKTYAEIDVNETPIVVLGCGHFFTAETLDGLIGMHDAYVTNTSGQFTGLADMSGALSSKVPQCPDCQRPVQQYITKRYNRVVNRAVVDEMSKRFLINGKTNLRVLEVKLRGLEKALEESRSRVCDSIGFIFDTDNGRVPQSSRVTNRIGNRYEECKGFLKDVKQFLKGVSDRYQPAHRLHEATIHAAGRIQSKSVDKMLASLSLHGSISPVERDRRVTLAGRMMQIEVEYIVLEDKFSIATTVKSKKPAKIDPWPGGSPQQLAKPFLETCGAFIAECNNEHLPKLAVEASLCHARVAQFYRSSGLASDGDRQKAAAVVEEAKQHLEKALHLCGQPFQHAKQLRRAVQDIHDILQKERYEAVTRDELAAIKQAIVSGPDAIATHSGHWYNCVNGHPFAIGECGMPMEQARCPECGAPIGGSNHQTVAGVTRALDMEGGDDQH